MKGLLAGILLVLMAAWAVFVLDVLGVITVAPEETDGPILVALSLLLAVLGLSLRRTGKS